MKKITEPDGVAQKIVELFKEAIEEFYSKDSNVLFNEKEELDNSEMCMAGCIYKYFWRFLEKSQCLSKMQLSVDIEYNRVCLDDGPEIKRILHEECDKCSSRKCLVKQWSLRVDSAEKRYCRPDIICHKRMNGDHNLLVVEIKKRKEDCFVLNKNKYCICADYDFGYDLSRLSYFTCVYGKYHYAIGAMLILQPHRAFLVHVKSIGVSRIEVFDAKTQNWKNYGVKIKKKS